MYLKISIKDVRSLNLTKAIILSYIKYYTNNSSKCNKYLLENIKGVKRSSQRIADELCLSRKTIVRNLKDLENQNIINSNIINSNKSDHTKTYTVLNNDYAKNENYVSVYFYTLERFNKLGLKAIDAFIYSFIAAQVNSSKYSQRGENYTRISQAEISEAIAINVRTVQRSLATLQEYQIIKNLSKSTEKARYSINYEYTLLNKRYNQTKNKKIIYNEFNAFKKSAGKEELSAAEKEKVLQRLREFNSNK